MKQTIKLTENELKKLINECINESISEYNSFRISAKNDMYRNFLLKLIEENRVDAKECALRLIDCMDEEEIKDFVQSTDYFNKFRSEEGYIS